jgi:hypothetical protein
MTSVFAVWRLTTSSSQVWVAAETRVAPRPPHRSRRASFSHRALIEGQTQSAFGAWQTNPAPMRRLAASVTCLIRRSVRDMRCLSPSLMRLDLLPVEDFTHRALRHFRQGDNCLCARKGQGRHGLGVKAHGLAMTALGYLEPRRAQMPRDRTGKAKELGLVNSVQTVVDGVAAASLGGLAQADATIVADAARAQKRFLARWKENKANGRELDGAVKCKPVLCVNTGITYPSIGQAARHTGYSACRISAACNGRGSRSAFADGLEFRFAEIVPAIEKAAGPDARSTMRECRLRRLEPAVQTCEV